MVWESVRVSKNLAAYSKQHNIISLAHRVILLINFKAKINLMAFPPVLLRGKQAGVQDGMFAVRELLMCQACLGAEW